MSRVVTIQGDHPVFPIHACVNCVQPATCMVEIVKVKGQSVRKVSVPLCDDCIAVREAKSQRQVLFERVAMTNSLLLGLAVGIRTHVSIVAQQGQDVSNVRAWGALIGGLAMIAVVGAMRLIVQPWALRFRSQDTKALWRAVVIRDFCWETTTLEFANDEYAERFAQVNAAPEGKV